MDINRIIEKIKNHPESEKIGMIASHLGVVRGTSREGRKVIGIEVSYDFEALDNIARNIKSLPGIIEVIIDVREGILDVGDIIMFVAIGGDIRENVFPALSQIVDRIKKEPFLNSFLLY